MPTEVESAPGSASRTFHTSPDRKPARPMSEEPREGNPTLDQTRSVTIDALCEHFANDLISVEEFESRVEAAHGASSSGELRDLLRDLPGGDLPAASGPGTTPVPRPAAVPVSAAHVKEREVVVAIMGGSGRKGRWNPARRNYAVAVWGGAELDFREAVMAPGVTDLHIYTMWGGVDVIVPPGLNVETHGFALMGGFDHTADNLHAPDPAAPTLRITGIAVMGGVDISVRLPGETAREARKRRKLEGARQQRRLRP